MEEEDKKFVSWKTLTLIIVLIIIISAAALYFLRFEECNNIDCFTNRLEECKMARYIGGNQMIFEYKILGSKDNYCNVNVELLRGDLKNKDSVRLENQEMICNIPLGSIEIPGSDISKCTGRLKEGLQEILINKLHAYIVQNLGRINLDILDLPS